MKFDHVHTFEEVYNLPEPEFTYFVISNLSRKISAEVAGMVDLVALRNEKTAEMVQDKRVQEYLRSRKMTEETSWQEQLVADFPLLYRRCQYLEIPDAWQYILRELSEELEPLIQQYMKDNPDAKPDDPDDDIPCAVQVKSKFGGLRFYMSFQTEQMDEAIRKAEHRVEILRSIP